jgi:hypothetical protein
MDIQYATTDEPATPEYVLAVIRDHHRQQYQFDDSADCEAVLTLDTTVAEWRDACDLLGWRQLGDALNQIWGITCTDEEWRAVLEPNSEKRLADVCELIAKHARRRHIRPANLLGSPCESAGAFLTIRSLLHVAGACADEIAPSTQLAPYTRRYHDVFLVQLSRLAPGALPLVSIRKPILDTAIWGCFAGLLCFAMGGVVGAINNSYLLMAVGIAIFAASYLLAWVSAYMLPSSVDFG